MVAKTAASKKAKGAKLENKIAERYRHWKVDETARRMPLSGAMAHFKSDIYKRFDVDWIDEAKCHETISLAKFWEQTASQAGMRRPVLHISANFRPIITVIREEDFDELTDEDYSRFDINDITSKKRWSFWEHAKHCHDLIPRATVIYAVTASEAVVLMTIDTYMKLRIEHRERMDEARRGLV